jgi:hypothetical protein
MLIFVCSVLPLIFSLHAAADHLIYDDLIVNESICVGLECVNGEEFDFDTLKLKSDDPRIRFYDTSNSAAFPTTDWTMGVAKNADSSYFYVNDAAAGMSVLKLSAAESGGVALGAGAELEDSAVSVGAAGAERRIMHVADGIEPTDAVNVGQLEKFQSDIDPRLADLATQMADILTRIESLAARLENLENP